VEMAIGVGSSFNSLALAGCFENICVASLPHHLRMASPPG
jgi:hypothetical protein